MFMYVWLHAYKCLLKHFNLDALKYTHFLQTQSGHFNASELTC